MRSRVLAMSGASVLVLVGALMLLIYSGVYNVGATNGHTAPVEWALRTTMEKSVRHHGAGIAVPKGVDLRDRAYATRFYGHYSAACVTCHAAPGVPADPWMVNYPPSPRLTDAAVVDRWSDQELFWIIKHGIKDTAMIALGPTHKDEDIWGVAAIVRQLPGMTAEEYQAMSRAYEATKEAGASGMSGSGGSPATQPDGPTIRRAGHQHQH